MQKSPLSLKKFNFYTDSQRNSILANNIIDMQADLCKLPLVGTAVDHQNQARVFQYV